MSKKGNEPLTVFVNPDIKHRFKLECLSQKITMAEAIEKFMQDFTDSRRVKKAA